MVKGTPFEVSKEVYERAKNNSKNKDQKYFYMTDSDKNELFSAAIRCGYGLYNCMVHEEKGKYICTWDRGDSCD